MLQRLKGAIRHRLGLDRINNEIRELTDRVDLAERTNGAFHQVLMGTLAARTATVDDTPRISVVLATRDRCALLARAIDSVRASLWPHWELVVVDDGSADGTADLLHAVADERIVVVRTDGIGAAAARNLGLDRATGEWVTFLDDDNVMGAAWLRAIADFAGRHPHAAVAYGGQLREHEDGSAWPEHHQLLFVEPFDHERIRAGNFVDLGALAVRRDADQLWFDASLRRFIDWEMVARLAAVHEMHPLPVLASVYFTRHESRISHVGRPDDWDAFALRLQDPADEMGRPRPRP